MSKKLRLVAALGAMALLLSSCLFSIKGFSVSRRTIGPGDKAVLTFKLYPTFNSTTNLKAVPFIVFTQLEILPVMNFPSTGRRFDIKENFGGAPRPLVVDNGLRDYMVNGDGCGGYDEITSDGSVVHVFRTENPVNVKNKVNKVALTKVPMKMPNGADMTDIPAVPYTAIMGLWQDDPEAGTPGSPDPEDSIQCYSALHSDFANEVPTEPEEARADLKKAVSK